MICFAGTYDPPNHQRNLVASRSLLVIVSSPPINKNYSSFHAAVNRYNEMEPFSFPNPFNLPKKVTFGFVTKTMKLFLSKRRFITFYIVFCLITSARLS